MAQFLDAPLLYAALAEPGLTCAVVKRHQATRVWIYITIQCTPHPTTNVKTRLLDCRLGQFATG